MITNTILCGDSLSVLREMPDESVQTCVTSPPYWGLRDYGNEGQIGLEKTPEEYIEKMTKVFSEIKRVLRDDGTLWLNIGDSYAGSGRGRDADGTWNPGQGGSKQATNNGSTIGRQVNSKSLSRNAIEEGAIGNAWGYKQKDLIGIPWMLAFALRSDGWYLRSDIIWHKPNPMPESVTDRPTKSHEYIFLLSKSKNYYYDADAIKEPITDSTTIRMLQNVEAQTGKQWTPQMAKRPNGVNRNRELGYDSKENKLRGHKNMQPDGQEPNSIHVRRTEGMMDLPYAIRNKRSVWTVPTMPYKGAHFATFPEALITPCILAGAPEGGIVLDPFAGSGTTLAVAKAHNRKYIGIELNPEYIKLAEKRLSKVPENLFA